MRVTVFPETQLNPDTKDIGDNFCPIKLDQSSSRMGDPNPRLILINALFLEYKYGWLTDEWHTHTHPIYIICSWCENSPSTRKNKSSPQTRATCSRYRRYWRLSVGEAHPPRRHYTHTHR
jgi:hypothetical protein